MHIRKYQLGGIAYTPYIRESGAQTTSAGSQTSKSGKDEGDEIQKAIIKVLLENKGLPNDVNAFLSKANALMMNSTDIYGNVNYVMSDLIKLQSMANSISHNQTSYTNAVSRLESEDSGSEVAITNRGELYVIDKNGGLKIISADSYYENMDKYTALTQTELLNLREHSPSLAYNDTILPDLEGTIGLRTIVEYVQNSIAKFGTHTVEDKSVHYSEKEQGRIEQGFENILGGSSPDGVYKVTSTTKISNQGYNSTNNEGLVEAAQYLWGTLNQQMRHTLRAHTVAEGLDPNNPLDVYRTLIWAIQENTTHSFTRDINVDYDSTATAAKHGTSGTGGSGQTVDESWGHAVQMNYGTPIDAGMVLEGANTYYHFNAYRWGSIQDAEGKEVPAYTTASETLHNLRGQGILNPGSPAYFGDLKLNDTASNLIYVDNNKGGYVMYLPVDNNGNLNWDLIIKMGQIQDALIRDNITDEQHQATVWNRYGFDYDPEKHTGVPKGYTLGKFWVQHAVVAASDDPYDESLMEKSKFIVDFSGDSFESIEENYNASHKTNRDTIYPAGDAYSSMIFIPLNVNELESRIAGGMAETRKVDSSVIAAEIDALGRSGGWNFKSGTPIYPTVHSFDSLNQK